MPKWTMKRLKVQAVPVLIELKLSNDFNVRFQYGWVLKLKDTGLTLPRWP